MGDGYAYPLGSKNSPYPNSGEILRRTDAVAWIAAADGKVRPGKRPGPGGEASIVTGPERVRIQPLPALVVDTAFGQYKSAVPAVVDKAIGGRPSTGTSRIDRVILHVYDAGNGAGTTTQVDAFVEYVKGDESAANPSPKDISSLPGAVLELHQLKVPATGDIVITTRPLRTVGAGGILPVYDESDRTSLAAYRGLTVFREDLGILQVCTDPTTTPPIWRDIALVDDTGWVKATLTSGSRYGGGFQDVEYRRIGTMVHLRGVLGTPGAALAGGAVLFTLPEGCRPPATHAEGTLYGLNGFAPMQLNVNTDGKVTTALGVPANAAILVRSTFGTTTAAAATS